MATRSKARPKTARATRGAPRSTARPLDRATRSLTLRINGHDHALQLGRDLSPSMTLAALLKDRLGLTGLKTACDEGACGACTVLLDGKAVLSCMMLAVDAAGHDVETIEGVAPSDPVVQAFVEQCEPGYGTAIQCGYCTPGFVMTARGFLRENPRPTPDEVKEAMSGNICRCGCYSGIAQAVLHAAEKPAGRGGAR